MTVLVPGGTFAAPLKRATALSWIDAGRIAAFLYGDDNQTTPGSPIQYYIDLFIPSATVGAQTSVNSGGDYSVTIGGVTHTRASIGAGFDADGLTYTWPPTASPGEYSYFAANTGSPVTAYEGTFNDHPAFDYSAWGVFCPSTFPSATYTYDLGSVLWVRTASFVAKGSAANPVTWPFPYDSTPTAISWHSGNATMSASLDEDICRRYFGTASFPRTRGYAWYTFD